LYEVETVNLNTKKERAMRGKSFIPIAIVVLLIVSLPAFANGITQFVTPAPMETVGTVLLESTGQAQGTINDESPGLINNIAPISGPETKPGDASGGVLLEGSGQTFGSVNAESPGFINNMAPISGPETKPGDASGGVLLDGTGQVLGTVNAESPGVINGSAPLLPDPGPALLTGQDPESIYIDPLGLQGDPSTATTFHLQGAYPNPFNPTTTIRFLVEASGQVNLKVYNTAGSLVTALVNSRLEAGYHEVTFSGANLPSGVYFYRLQAGHKATVGTMSLVK
jgi:hypothetical protein